jgi:hypothetical protein
VTWPLCPQAGFPPQSLPLSRWFSLSLSGPPAASREPAPPHLLIRPRPKTVPRAAAYPVQGPCLQQPCLFPRCRRTGQRTMVSWIVHMLSWMAESWPPRGNCKRRSAGAFDARSAVAAGMSTLTYALSVLQKERNGVHTTNT